MLLDPFRKQALERLSSPEELDRLVRVSRPGTWIALAGLLLVIAGVVLWAILASIATTVSGLGYVLPEGGLLEASAARAGIVQRIDVEPGQRVEPGDVVAKLEAPDGSELSITAPASGKVAEVQRTIGDFVPQGGEVAIVRPDRELVVEAFVPHPKSKGIHVGDRVWVAPSTAAVSEYGFARGWVAGLGEVPISDTGLDSLLENPARARRVAQLGPVNRVVVKLVAADTPSGLSWTASQGPAEPVTFGTTAEVEIVTGRRAPIDYVAG
jgi:pyruvate/2-oxoglutarate dehydrogenase complex dihydrolipoamide acyltransferase (E2) component